MRFSLLPTFSIPTFTLTTYPVTLLQDEVGNTMRIARFRLGQFLPYEGSHRRHVRAMSPGLGTRLTGLF